MASTVDKPATSAQLATAAATSAVAFINEEDLEAARRDPRVAAFLDDADAYLIAFEQQGRNR
jgi:hypothetical protein